MSPDGSTATFSENRATNATKFQSDIESNTVSTGQHGSGNTPPMRNSLPSSLREHVRPGKSKRTHFPLIPSKVALLMIDIQEFLSSPSSVQDEHDRAYFYHAALPRMISHVEKLVQQTRQQRDSQSQGCEVIFTYLEALTQDCRDVSLDYKLSGALATIPNSAVSPANFLESVMPLTRDGKGDIMIPKTSCSVFMSTNLHYVLQNLHVEQLLVCGQLTDQCVESAVRDAADLGYFVTVIEDACAAQSEDAHQKGLSGMKGFSRILSTQQVLEELQNAPEEVVITRSIAAATEPVHEAVVEQQRDISGLFSDISILSSHEWNPPFCNEDAATTALLHTMQFAGVKFLRYMAVDACNSIRCKAVPLQQLIQKKQLDHQVSIAQVCFAGLPTYGDYMMESTGLDAQQVLTLKPDVGSLRILPYAPTSAVVLGTAVDPASRRVSPLCTRGLLSRVVETARQHGIEFYVGVEIEFCLFKEGTPVDQSVFGNVTTMNEQQEFVDTLDTQLQQQQIQLEQIHAESAPGQMELVLAYQDDPIRMADWVVMTRETITTVAKSHGLVALFLPKIYDDKAGNGCHVHLSFRETNSSRSNAFPHATLNGDMSAVAKSFLEGILRHLPALLSLTMPTDNSFRRVGPGCWTGSVIGWEMEDKEAALRVCMDTTTGQWTNVEYKLCDSTANLYLALSGILSCGLNGIVQRLTLRPAFRQEEMEQDSQATLPSSLQESLVCLQKDEFLSKVVGAELSKAYIAVRQAASEKFANLSLEEEVAMALKKS